MNSVKYAVSALAIVTAATAAQAERLFVFGDSLVDSGNIDDRLRAAGQPTRTPPQFGYFDGRFSNGYNFADYVSLARIGSPAIEYGVPGTPPAAGLFPNGDNFSFGGALTGEVAGDPVPSFLEQIGLFAQSGKTIGANDLVLVTFGGNDLQQEILKYNVDRTYEPNLASAASALTSGLNALYASGARRVIVTGQADIGQIPRITQYDAEVEEKATAEAKLLNTAFAIRTALARKTFGADFEFFDLFQFQKNLLADPMSGFTNTTTQCLNQQTGMLANPTCQGFLYFDNIHPTTAAHERIGAAILAQVPEPQSWATMMLGFGVVGLAARRRRRVAAA